MNRVISIWEDFWKHLEDIRGVFKKIDDKIITTNGKHKYTVLFFQHFHYPSDSTEEQIKIEYKQALLKLTRRFKSAYLKSEISCYIQDVNRTNFMEFRGYKREVIVCCVLFNGDLKQKREYQRKINLAGKWRT